MPGGERAASHSPPPRVRLTEVNPHLVCVLCHGYFVDATTITECLHSFCRSCIFRHLETKNFCPICEAQVQARLHRSLKPDKTLQDIVYKLVPGLFHDEMWRRRRFYADHPHRDLHMEPERRGVGQDRLIYSPSDVISISLEFYDTEREKEEWSAVTLPPHVSEPDPLTPTPVSNNNNKRYLQCPAVFKMAHVKKFLRQKYNLPATAKLEIIYKRECLPDSYSLMDVAYIYTWKRNGPMRFYYRISEPAEACPPLHYEPASHRHQEPAALKTAKPNNSTVENPVSRPQAQLISQSTPSPRKQQALEEATLRSEQQSKLDATVRQLPHQTVQKNKDRPDQQVKQAATIRPQPKLEVQLSKSLPEQQLTLDTTVRHLPKLPVQQAIVRPEQQLNQDATIRHMPSKQIEQQATLRRDQLLTLDASVRNVPKQTEQPATLRPPEQQVTHNAAAEPYPKQAVQQAILRPDRPQITPDVPVRHQLEQNVQQAKSQFERQQVTPDVAVQLQPKQTVQQAQRQQVTPVVAVQHEPKQTIQQVKLSEHLQVTQDTTVRQSQQTLQETKVQQSALPPRHNNVEQEAIAGSKSSTVAQGITHATPSKETPTSLQQETVRETALGYQQETRPSSRPTSHQASLQPTTLTDRAESQPSGSSAQPKASPAASPVHAAASPAHSAASPAQFTPSPAQAVTPPVKNLPTTTPSCSPHRGLPPTVADLCRPESCAPGSEEGGPRRVSKRDELGVSVLLSLAKYRCGTERPRSHLVGRDNLNHIANQLQRRATVRTTPPPFLRGGPPASVSPSPSIPPTSSPTFSSLPKPPTSVSPATLSLTKCSPSSAPNIHNGVAASPVTKPSVPARSVPGRSAPPKSPYKARSKTPGTAMDDRMQRLYRTPTNKESRLATWLDSRFGKGRASSGGTPRPTQTALPAEEGKGKVDEEVVRLKRKLEELKRLHDKADGCRITQENPCAGDGRRLVRDLTPVVSIELMRGKRPVPGLKAIQAGSEAGGKRPRGGPPEAVLDLSSRPPPSWPPAPSPLPL